MSTAPLPFLTNTDPGDEQATRWYVHKHQIALDYGGPEEGGWWFKSGWPDESWSVVSFTDEEEAYAFCRSQNEQEHERREAEEQYDFTSVLADRSEHFEFTVEDFPTPRRFPESRPHYE